MYYTRYLLLICNSIPSEFPRDTSIPSHRASTQSGIDAIRYACVHPPNQVYRCHSARAPNQAYSPTPTLHLHPPYHKSVSKSRTRTHTLQHKKEATTRPKERAVFQHGMFAPTGAGGLTRAVDPSQQQLHRTLPANLLAGTRHFTGSQHGTSANKMSGS